MDLKHQCKELPATVSGLVWDNDTWMITGSTGDGTPFMMSYGGIYCMYCGQLLERPVKDGYYVVRLTGFGRVLACCLTGQWTRIGTKDDAAFCFESPDEIVKYLGSIYLDDVWVKGAKMNKCPKCGSANTYLVMTGVHQCSRVGCYLVWTERQS